MATLAAVLAVAGFVAAGVYFQHRLSGGRMWSPLWMAFSFTAAATVLLVRVAFWSGSAERGDLLLLAVFVALAIGAWAVASRTTLHR
ncbi:MAG TPA: hypothetical protein VFO19_04320 [Vicinamibacterales bacterium]|nr:hypothetical protein [Vicinamibacterales bacterium]